MIGLIAIIRERAADASDPLPCHWITSDTEGFEYDVSYDFCYECAEFLIDEFVAEHPDDEGDIHLDGGFGTDHDSPPYCEFCGARLSGSLTKYGIDSELEHFEGHPPSSPDDWAAFLDAVEGLDEGDGDDRWIWIAQHVEAAERADLLVVLSARTEQLEARQ